VPAGAASAVPACLAQPRRLRRNPTGDATIETKTNFFVPIPVGDTAFAECTPLHRGRPTMVWQTRIMWGDGRLCALTQTQIVIPDGKPSRARPH
jgi:acyl-coenzyme A thioesterase PaaI-like protein